MSDRHMHVTGYLYDEERVIGQFMRAAESTGFFFAVVPVRVGGVLRAVALYSRDTDDCSDEIAMPEIAERLSGILRRDVMIASAWDNAPYRHERQHAWLVRGTGGHVAGQVVRDPGELPGPARPA